MSESETRTRSTWRDLEMLLEAERLRGTRGDTELLSP